MEPEPGSEAEPVAEPEPEVVSEREPEEKKQVYFDGSLDSPLSSCIIIASHLSKKHRVRYLFECLESLFAQTIVIPVYLSFSFENQEINNEFAKEFISRPHLHNDLLYLYPQDTKTAQMRHIFQLYPLLRERYHWLFFCDDDDTYELNRVEKFLNNIKFCLQNYETADKKFRGIYECQEDVDHRKRRHEYWCYCIHSDIFDKFYNLLLDYPDIVDHKCCDVLLAEYIRRHKENDIFAGIKDKLYNYRRTDNSDSITGEIQMKNKLIRQPRNVTDDNRQECANELNEFLDDNLDMYLHDTFLYSIVGKSLDSILESEFKGEYCIVDLIRPNHIERIKKLYSHLVEICNNLYEIPISQ
uniref:Glycosyltransferase 2-like domain-containing protein n=1 Tax=viral metagenome TaxID=1070528 RepID=A0A6C0DS03_9ZZZZ